MKKAADLIIAVGAISMVIAIISRISMKPISGVFASAILQFSGVCFLLAIALVLREK